MSPVLDEMSSTIASALSSIEPAATVLRKSSIKNRMAQIAPEGSAYSDQAQNAAHESE